MTTNLKWPKGGRTIQTVHTSLSLPSWSGWLFSSFMPLMGDGFFQAGLTLSPTWNGALCRISPSSPSSSSYVSIYPTACSCSHPPPLSKCSRLASGKQKSCLCWGSLISQCRAQCLALEHSLGEWRNQCSEKHYPQMYTLCFHVLNMTRTQSTPWWGEL